MKPSAFPVDARVEIDKDQPPHLTGDRTGPIPGPRTGTVIGWSSQAVIVSLDKPEGNIRSRFIATHRLTIIT